MERDDDDEVDDLVTGEKGVKAAVCSARRRPKTAAVANFMMTLVGYEINL